MPRGLDPGRDEVVVAIRSCGRYADFAATKQQCWNGGF